MDNQKQKEKDDAQKETKPQQPVQVGSVKVWEV